MRLPVLRALFAASIGSLTFAAAAFAEEAPTYKKLSDRRAEISLPSYTPEERTLVAEQALVVLGQVYVNRERKIAFYGAANDPVPAARQVVADAPTITDAELHARLEVIFQSQHDFHLSYSYPAPFACYRTALPFTLALARHPNGQTVVAVSSRMTTEEILALDPSYARVEVGDVLLAYDGVDPLVAAKALENLAGGSNEFGRVRAAIDLLTWRSQRIHTLPVGDSVHMKFANRLGQVYELDLPWFTVDRPACLNPSQGGDGHVVAKFDGADEDQIEFERFFKPHRRESETEAIVDTDEPTLHYDIVENEYGRFGILRLDSFVPESLTIKETVALIKKLLENELAGTDGLIFDLRDNGGGQIEYGESLVQLFTPVDVSPTRFRLLNSQANRDIMRLSPVWGEEFAQAILDADARGARYTEALPFATPLVLNGVGQSYFKPVAVLINSSCYSTCDMTTASLQDHGVATIYGEDGSTGGGGANNMQLADFVAAFPENEPTTPLKALPGHQGMGMAWRQAVRMGLHDGQLLEETGAVADKVLLPTLADFFNQSSDLIRRISADLNVQSVTRDAWFKRSTGERIDMRAGAPIRFAMQVSATDAVELRDHGVTLGTQVINAPASEDGTSVQIDVPGSPAVGTLGSAEIIGLKAGARVWRAVAGYRVVPTATAFGDGARVALDFASTDPAPLAIFTAAEGPAQGWSVVNGKLKTGSGTNYADAVTTEASLFLDLTTRTAPTTLSFDLEGATEQGYDFFAVTAVVDGVSTELIPAVSGPIAAAHETFDLAPFLGHDVELRFGFASDSGVTDTGVLIDNVVVE